MTQVTLATMYSERGIPTEIFFKIQQTHFSYCEWERKVQLSTLISQLWPIWWSYTDRHTHTRWGSHTDRHTHACTRHVHTLSFKIDFGAYKYKMTNIIHVTTNFDCISYISLVFPFLSLFIYSVSYGSNCNSHLVSLLLQ